MNGKWWSAVVVAVACALPVAAGAAGAPPAGAPASKGAPPAATAPADRATMDAYAALDFEDTDLLAAELGPGGPREAPMGDGGYGGGMGMHHGGPGGMGMHGGPGGGGMGGERMHQHLMRMADKLQLSETQRGKIRDIMEQQQRRSIQQRADIQIATLDLHKLMRADTPNKTSIDAQVDKIARMRATLAKERIGAMLQAHAVLTPEQKQQLKSMQSERMKMHDRDDDGPGGSGKP